MVSVESFSVGAAADRQVEALGDQVDLAVGGAQVDADVGVAARELGQDLGQHDDGDVLGRGHAQLARRHGGAFGQLLDGLVQRDHVRRDALVEGDAGGRQGDGARGAVDQLGAELFFQLADRAADRSLADAQAARRLGEALLVGDGDEGGEQLGVGLCFRHGTVCCHFMVLFA